MEDLERDVAGPAPPLAAPYDAIQAVEQYLRFRIPAENDNNVGEQNDQVQQAVRNMQQNGGNLPGFLDYAALFHLSQRRRMQEHDLRRQDVAPGGFFDPNPEVDYRPLSPQHSDEDAEVFRLANARRQAERVIGNMRQYLHEENNGQQEEAENVRIPEVNNNGNYRDHNGYLSPSPSPSPQPNLMEFEASEDDEDEQPRAEDMEVEMLMAQMVQMQPNQSRPRKRHNSERHEEVVKKKVTFKEPSESARSDELPGNYHLDDDDEGFFGGPPTRHSSYTG